MARVPTSASYIIELAPPASTGAPRRIGKLTVFARGAPERVKTSGRPTTKRTKGRKSSATKPKRGKPSATKTKQLTN